LGHVNELISMALAEDFGDGDVTSLYFVDGDLQTFAQMRSRCAGVLSGIRVAEAVFKAVDQKLEVVVHLEDAAILGAGSIIMTIRGKARLILGAERPALNFIQRLCGIASMTHVYTKVISHTKCHLLDTRKTTPGYSILEKQVSFTVADRTTAWVSTIARW